MNKRDVLLNTEAHRPAFNDFADAFDRIERREHWRQGEIVTHWLDAAFRAVRGRILHGEAFEQNEAEYMRIVKRCREPKATMADFATMLGATVLALDAAPIDFVGPVYAAFAANPHAGQFFTPYSLSRMMAEMVIGERRNLLKRKRFILMGEPSCGVGGMILAANQVLQERGINVATEAHWVAVDIDYRAMCGAYIQTALTGSSATIIHGNTLAGEQWLATITPAAAMFPKHISDPPPMPLPKATTAAARPAAPVRGSQYAFEF
jgi:hypothetical protein